MFLLPARLPVSADKAGWGGGGNDLVFLFPAFLSQAGDDGGQTLSPCGCGTLQKNENKNISLGFRLQHPSCKRMRAVNLKTRGS